MILIRSIDNERLFIKSIDNKRLIIKSFNLNLINNGVGALTIGTTFIVR